MTQLNTSLFSGTLEAVASLRDRHIEARVEELKREDEVTLALRSALSMGMNINSLSEASGLTVSEIRSRTERELRVIEDTRFVAGLA